MRLGALQLGALAAGLLVVPGAASAATRPSVPGRFAVQGAPLVKRAGVTAGRSISVFARPPAVVVEGCRARSATVSVHGRRARVAAGITCAHVPGAFRLRATISGRRLRGTFTTARRVRRFTAVLRSAPGGSGGLLAGRSSARALTAVKDVDRLERHPGSEVSDAPHGARIARTEIVMRLKPAATVGQVNAALRSVGGVVAGSLDGSPRLIVATPDPGSLAALDAVIAALGRMPGVQSASRSEMAVTATLPPSLGSPPTASQATALSHLLALRMPAAWNARRAIRLGDRPTLIVVDHFGAGPLGRYVDAACAGCVFARGIPDPVSHGYHVVGIAAANFANDGTKPGLVTGVFPATTRLKVIDLEDQTIGAGTVRALQAIKDTPGRVVLNTSFGHSEISGRDSLQEGDDWAAAVRTAGVTGRYVHAASAGNAARGEDPVAAELVSDWGAAALRHDLTDPQGQPVPPLPNTLIAENLTDTGAPAYEAGCLAAKSDFGGQVAAVGSAVFSLIKRQAGARVADGAGDLSGTSMASPQVAALAEYVWSVAPGLTPEQVTALLVATARQPVDAAANHCPRPGASAPRLDAYAAVLGADKPVAVTPATAPVRLAILDRNDDGAFDAADVTAHAAAIRAPNRGLRDWGRSDLNGDGFTGVGTSAPVPFDLDPVRGAGTPPAAPATVHENIAGGPVAFNEAAVSDLDVLCYYTHSGLFSGTPAQRDALLTSDLTGCGQPLTVTPSAGAVAPGHTIRLTAKVGDVSDSTVAWAATGGSVSSSGVYTAPHTPGTYTVAAADVTDPTRSASATIVVVNLLPGGVTRVQSFGQAHASVSDANGSPRSSSCGGTFSSAPGVATFHSTPSCTFLGVTAGGSASFTETSSGGSLVSVDFSGSGSGSGPFTHDLDPAGFGYYSLSFTVGDTRPVAVSVTFTGGPAEDDGVRRTGSHFSLRDQGADPTAPPIIEADGSSDVSRAVTLTPGTYGLEVVGSTHRDTPTGFFTHDGSADVSVTFGS